MPRPQSADYDKRREAILAEAAKLYARHGFLGASVADLAVACKTSKSLVYHYYPSKEDVLYGVMSAHLDDLVGISGSVMSSDEASPEVRLRELTLGYMQVYVDAAASHKVLLNELDNLPADKRTAIIARQREIIGSVESLLLQIRPELAGHGELKRPLTMLFFGMINWTHTWYSAKGRVEPASLAIMAVDLMLNGLRSISLDDHAS